MRRMQAFFTNASAEEGSDLVVFGEPARLTQPGKGSLHNPAPVKMRCWQRLITCMFQPNMLSAQLIRLLV